MDSKKEAGKSMRGNEGSGLAYPGWLAGSNMGPTPAILDHG